MMTVVRISSGNMISGNMIRENPLSAQFMFRLVMDRLSSSSAVEGINERHAWEEWYRAYRTTAMLEHDSLDCDTVREMINVPSRRVSISISPGEPRLIFVSIAMEEDDSDSGDLMLERIFTSVINTERLSLFLPLFQCILEP